MALILAIAVAPNPVLAEIFTLGISVYPLPIVLTLTLVTEPAVGGSIVTVGGNV